VAAIFVEFWRRIYASYVGMSGFTDIFDEALYVANVNWKFAPLVEVHAYKGGKCISR
jgi:hypothetical protein